MNEHSIHCDLLFSVGSGQYLAQPQCVAHSIVPNLVQLLQEHAVRHRVVSSNDICTFDIVQMLFWRHAVHDHACSGNTNVLIVLMLK